MDFDKIFDDSNYIPETEKPSASPRFSELPKETQDELETRAKTVIEEFIPKKIQPLIYQVAKQLNIHSLDVVLAYMDSLGSQIKGKIVFDVGGERIMPDCNLGLMSPFKEDYKIARMFFDSQIEEIKKAHDRKKNESKKN